jgi:ribosomal protein L11 methyltransferase
LDKHLHPKSKVLDFGCGSGILGLAALLLGAEHMDGIDIDPQAITATRNNAETNDIATELYSVTVDSEELDDQYDVVIANILASTLDDLSETIISKVTSGGSLILSGILTHQAEFVIDSYKNSINFAPITEKDGWVCLSGTKK